PAAADISASQLVGLTADVAGNFAAPLAIGMVTNTAASFWNTQLATFNGTFTAAASVNPVFTAGGTAATRTTVFSAAAVGVAGWQSPFLGGLDFWVLDNTLGVYVLACTAGT